MLSNNRIVGTLKYVTGYTGFSSVSEEQSGNYLALKFDTNVEEPDSITVELVGGTKGPVTLDEDRMHVMRIKDKTIKTIKVVTTVDEQEYVENYDISRLVLTPVSE